MQTFWVIYYVMIRCPFGFLAKYHFLLYVLAHHEGMVSKYSPNRGRSEINFIDPGFEKLHIV